MPAGSRLRLALAPGEDPRGRLQSSRSTGVSDGLLSGVRHQSASHGAKCLVTRCACGRTRQRSRGPRPVSHLLWGKGTMVRDHRRLAAVCGVSSPRVRLATTVRPGVREGVRAGVETGRAEQGFAADRFQRRLKPSVRRVEMSRLFTHFDRISPQSSSLRRSCKES